MKKFIKSDRFIYILLAIIIIAGIGRYSYGFFVQKQGSHSDEIWSFGLANSYYEPYLYAADKRDEYRYKNSNEWVSGDTIREYLTVQDGEQFSFGSVYYNLSCDMHPPLYFYLLHFLSSFFVDQYIPALAFIINMVCFIFLSVYLYKLSFLVLKSKPEAIMIVGFNTFTTGALSMFIFLRMYAMLAMFAVILAYLTAKLYYIPESRGKWSAYVSMGIITFLGAMTHHYFLPYAFIIAAVMCIYWLAKRNHRVLLCYAGCMLAGVALSIAAFPATLDHMFGIQTVEYRDADTYDEFAHIDAAESDTLSVDLTGQIENYELRLFKYFFEICSQYLFRDSITVSPIVPYNRGILIYLPIALIILMILYAATAFLFRKEAWFTTFQKSFRNAIKSSPRMFATHIKNINWFVVAIILSIVFIVVLCSATVNVQVMGLANRYLFIVYPIFNMLLCALFIKLIMVCAHKCTMVIKYAFIGMAVVITLLVNNFMCTSEYLWNSTSNTDLLKSISKDSDVIIISQVTWHQLIYAPLVYDCNEYFFTTYECLQDNLNLINTNTSDRPLYLVVDVSKLYEKSATQSESEGDAEYYEDLEIPNYMYKDTVIDNIKSLTSITRFEHIAQTVFFNKSMEIYRLR